MRSSQGLPQAARRGSLGGFAHVTGAQLLLSRRGRLLGVPQNHSTMGVVMALTEIPQSHSLKSAS
jgi:hypothetical protein